MNQVTVTGRKPWDQQNDTERTRTLASVRRSGTKHAHPAWALIRSEARALGWPEAFEADLYIHDHRALARVLVTKEASKAPFLWAVGRCGTQLTWIATEPFGERESREHVLYLESERPRMFYWDGATLRSCTPHEAINVLCGRAWGALDY
jgi:hypothetical protein